MGKDIDFDKDYFWKAAVALRNKVAANEYRDIVLGLVFIKYLSDSFSSTQEKIKTLCSTKGSKLYTEDPEEVEIELKEKNNYISENVFWVDEKASWDYLSKYQAHSDIGKRINAAMETIEKENRELKGLLPKKYLMPGLDSGSLGELITLLTNITAGHDTDFLGRVYEYYMSRFAERGGSQAGEFFTPRSVVRLLVEMLEPYKGRIFDPACGSGGMFVQSVKFIEAHQGKKQDLSIYGQENIDDCLKLCKMNLAIRGIKGEIKIGNSYHEDQFKGLKADFVIANPPFNTRNWGSDRIDSNDSRFNYGEVPDSNANYMWIQHFITHLSNNGLAGFVMANGSMNARGQEGKIRKAIIEDDLVDCVVALAGKLFFTTGIPTCLWFISKNKPNRKGKTLFIDARKKFTQIDRSKNDMSIEQIESIANVYHEFKQGNEIENINGFCKVADLDLIKQHDYILTPGTYVGAEDLLEEEEDYGGAMVKLQEELIAHFSNSRKLESAIINSLKKMDHGK